jgi:hypothetical protein
MRSSAKGPFQLQSKKAVIILDKTQSVFRGCTIRQSESYGTLLYQISNHLHLPTYTFGLLGIERD